MEEAAPGPMLPNSTRTTTLQQLLERAPHKVKKKIEPMPVMERPTKREPLPLLWRIGMAAHAYRLRASVVMPYWLQSWGEYWNKIPGGPDFIKSYECRPRLPVR